MAPERPVTPEKQLLRLIEEHKGQNPTAFHAQAIKHRSLSLLSFGAWLGRFSFSKDWLKKKLDYADEHPLDIRLVNQVAIFCVYILAFYFLVNFASSLISLGKLPYLEVKPAEGTRSLNLMERVSLKKAVSSYLEKVRDRDIFKIGATKKVVNAEGVETTVKVTSSKIVEATQNLRLVGISWSNDPDAMIEDTKVPRTFFVKTGQKIGDVKVQAIFKDKVVLSYSGEEIELR